MDPLSLSVGAAGKAIEPAAAEAAKVAGNILTRLLGPLADEMGATLVAKYRVSNVQRVARRAAEKVALDVDGAVPARVAAAVFDAAQWAEEEFVTEYLSGVLAAARTPDGRDDSAVAWTALVARMPTAAIKLHHALYVAFHTLVAGMKVESLNQLTDRDFYVSAQAAMDLLEDTSEDGTFTQDAVHLLQAEGLIATQGWGTVDYLQGIYRPRQFPEAGLVFRAAPRGMLLILQAFGLSSVDPESIVRSDLSFRLDGPEVDNAEPLPALWVDELPVLT